MIVYVCRDCIPCLLARIALWHALTTDLDGGSSRWPWFPAVSGPARVWRGRCTACYQSRPVEPPWMTSPVPELCECSGSQSQFFQSYVPWMTHWPPGLVRTPSAGPATGWLTGSGRCGWRQTSVPVRPPSDPAGKHLWQKYETIKHCLSSSTHILRLCRYHFLHRKLINTSQSSRSQIIKILNIKPQKG